MIHRAIFIGLILTLLIGATVGCHRVESSVRRQLHTADSLMDLRPDSALAILSQIKADSLRGELRPWHALLLTKAMLKNHMADTTDTLINIAVDHYSGRGDSLDYQSDYYQGVIYSGMERFDRSLVALHEAHDKATAAGDLFYQAMSARELSTVYYGLDNVSKELEWAEKAKQLFTEAKKPVHAAWMDIDISGALTYNHRPAEALEVIEQVEEKMLGEDRSFRNKILKSKAVAQYMAKDYTGTVETYTQLLDEGTDMGANHKFRLASSLIHLGRDDEAMRLIEEAESDRMYEPDSLYRLYLLADINARKGNMAAAYELITEYARKLGQSDEKKLIVSPTDLLTDTYRLRSEIQQLKIKSGRLTILVEVIICLFLIVGIIMLWFVMKARIDRQYKKIKELRDTAQKLKDDFNFNKEALKLEEERSRQLREDGDRIQIESYERERRYIEEMRALFASHVSVLNDMCISWYRNGSTSSSVRVKKDLYPFLREFLEPEVVEKMVGIIDRYDDGWMTRFFTSYPTLSINDRLLSMYLYMGFSHESIMMLMNKQNPQSVFTSKYKLKVKLMKSECFDVLDIPCKLGMKVLGQKSEKKADGSIEV